MRTPTSLLLAATAVAIVANPAAALQANPSHTHIGHVATAFPECPGRCQSPGDGAGRSSDNPSAPDARGAGYVESAMDADPRRSRSQRD
jgi:hypothetical protein